METKIKFLKKGIKINGVYYRVWYSKGSYTKESKIPEDTITIYKRDYGHFPNIDSFNIINDSDYQTDYFEKDRVRITLDNIYYKQVLEVMS